MATGGKEHLQTKVRQSVADRVEAYEEAEELSGEYQTVSELIKAGLEAEGYGTAADGGHQRLSLIRQTLQETQRGLFFIGVAWLAATYLTAANMALPAVIAGGLGLVCFGLEPRVDSLAGRFADSHGGGSGA